MKEPKEKDFRIESMFYEHDLHYHVEQYRNGKWRLVIGGFKEKRPLQKLLDAGGGELLVKKMNEAMYVTIAVAIIVPAILIIRWLLT